MESLQIEMRHSSSKHIIEDSLLIWSSLWRLWFLWFLSTHYDLFCNRTVGGLTKKAYYATCENRIWGDFFFHVMSCCVLQQDSDKKISIVNCSIHDIINLMHAFLLILWPRMIFYLFFYFRQMFLSKKILNRRKKNIKLKDHHPFVC